MNLPAKASKEIRGATSAVRTHMTIFDKIRDRYLVTIKRAEADYFEAIKQATEALVGADAENQSPPPRQPTTPPQ